jgi:hypothetical protein
MLNSRGGFDRPETSLRLERTKNQTLYRINPRHEFASIPVYSRHFHLPESAFANSRGKITVTLTRTQKIRCLSVKIPFRDLRGSLLSVSA